MRGVVGVLLGLLVADAEAAVPRARASFTPRVLSVPCDGPVPAGATCGVIENVSDPDARRPFVVRVPFVRLPATDGEADAVPAVLLPGGPGQFLLFDLAEVADVTRPWRTHRALIVLDPRGAGASTPRLTCDPWPTGGTDVALAACAARLRRDGVSLDAFRTARLASDIAVLASSVPGGKLHVVGASYGTRWASTLATLHPDVVASLTLAAPAPWTQGLFEHGLARREEVVGDVLQRCSEDPACADAAGDVSSAWSLLRSRADAADRVSLLLRAALRTDELWTLPGLVRALAVADDLTPWRATLGSPRLGAFEPLLHASVTCADEVPFVVRGPGYDAVALREVEPACAAVSVTPSPASLRVLASLDVPALVVAGGLDPIEPVVWARQTAAALPRATLWIEPLASHDVSITPCAAEAIGAFLASPAAFTPPVCAPAAPTVWRTEATTPAVP